MKTIFSLSFCLRDIIVSRAVSPQPRSGSDRFFRRDFTDILYNKLTGKWVIMTIKMAALDLKINMKIRSFLGHCLSKVKLIPERFG